MTPVRPQEAGARIASIEAELQVSRAVATSASPTSGSALYAALDLGTNSCRMLIAEPKGSQFTVIDSFSKSVQLGLGLEASGRLGRASMERAVQDPGDPNRRPRGQLHGRRRGGAHAAPAVDATGD